MLDIETLGITPGSVILEAVAVVFDENDLNSFDDLLGKRSLRLSLNFLEQLQLGLQVDPETAKFWNKRDLSKYNPLLLASASTKSLSSSLRELNEFCLDYTKASGSIWCNSPSFDMELLKYVYRISKTTWDSPYWCERDVRTIKNFFRIDLKAPEGFEKHNPLHDCAYQCMVVQAARNTLTTKSS